MAKLTISPTVVKVLKVIRLGEPVTPTEINTHVGDGDYASKHVWYLRKLGFEFTIQKDGRKVVSYTLIKEPDNAEAIRNTVHGAAKKAATPKAPKAPKAPKPTKPAAPAKPAKAKAAKKGGNAANLAMLKQIGMKFRKPVDEVEATFGDSGEIGSIDGGWDSIDGLDLSKII